MSRNERLGEPRSDWAPLGLAREVGAQFPDEVLNLSCELPLETIQRWKPTQPLPIGAAARNARR